MLMRSYVFLNSGDLDPFRSITDSFLYVYIGMMYMDVILEINNMLRCFFLIDREEDGLFGDDEEEEAQLGVPKQFYYDEYDDPYDILKMMMNYVDNDAGTCLHLATKVNPMLIPYFLGSGKNNSNL